jgi:hypothetical protein
MAPAAMAVAPLRPDTITGLVAQPHGVVKVQAPPEQESGSGPLPLPSWPFAADPQHWTVPPESNAQVWYCPAAIVVAPLRFETVTGLMAHGDPEHVSGPDEEPLPSSPSALVPQHWTVPPDKSAQTC